MKVHQTLYDLIINNKYSDEEHLQVWVDKGVFNSKCIHSQTPNINGVLSYTVNLLISDTKSNELDIFCLITWWLNIYQPDRKPEAFTFEADHKNKTTADIFIQIDINEKVIATTNEDGETIIKTCTPAVIIDDTTWPAELWIHDTVLDESEQLGQPVTDTTENG